MLFLPLAISLSLALIAPRHADVVTGTVLGPDGKPVPNAVLTV
jgi:protocatechuate 3,4-dioxygenase beta subunit